MRRLRQKICSIYCYLQLSQRSTRTALYCRSVLYYKDSQVKLTRYALLVFVRSCSSINNKIISFKKFISPQPVGGPWKRKKIRGRWARAQCAHWLRRPCCTSLQTDNHASTPSLSFFTGRMPFLPPNQQRQSTEGKRNADLFRHSEDAPSETYWIALGFCLPHSS